MFAAAGTIGCRRSQRTDEPHALSVHLSVGETRANECNCDITSRTLSDTNQAADRTYEQEER